MTALERLRDAVRYGVSRVVLGGLWFGVLTPVALVLRAFGRDELRLRAREGSLWRPRDDPGSGDLERPF